MNMKRGFWAICRKTDGVELHDSKRLRSRSYIISFDFMRPVWQ